MTYTPPPVPKKSNTGLIVGIILGVVLLICGGTIGATFALGMWAKDKVEEAVDNLPAIETQPPATGTTGSHTVRYEVEGSGQATLNWGKGTGGQEGVTTDLPWSTEITVKADNFGLIISGVPRSKDTSVKSCRILVDGKEVKKVEAKNGFATCTFTYVGKA
ncbi:MAG TPA: MmpS family transport accessory protein [Candidatus Limnocylindrales bacterium]